MFYKIIEKKRNEWLNSPDCVVGDLIAYIVRQGKLRDAQIESIKTYLFLKIACNNLPLWQLFASGRFCTTDVDSLEVTSATRHILRSNPAALALWEYASINDHSGKPFSPKIIEAIKQNPEAIDYEAVIKNLFFNVTYTDYLFSLPMGAGKTFLMAVLIYLNLYFATLEPQNEAFAHNFIIFVPSGLKSSIIPSLRDIQNFRPQWIIPDPVATSLKHLLRFEWLQEAATASRSNLVRNPNARKVSLYTSDPDIMGLVAITNAEKVILDKIDKDYSTDETLLRSLPEAERKEFEATMQANELRHQIGLIPGLCILIDEVHHASDDQKLRKVVNKWMSQNNFNSVLGFSGTPNMPPYSINITAGLSVKITQYANVVTYYPLVEGVGNFLKTPTVRYANLDSSEIVATGLQEFFEKYAHTRYADGTSAKIAIYAPSINVLEEELFPEVCRLCSGLGLDPAKTILRYHKGNDKHKVADDAPMEFAMLDSPMSRKRVILLVGIGREGWNCKSLTGVILSQRNACPQNMVLQISCRCLREVDSAKHETALIWLNKWNADTLNRQLQQQQFITIKEFGGKPSADIVSIHRHSRMQHIKLPPIDYFQIKINYNTVCTDRVTDVREYLRTYSPPALDAAVIYTQGFDAARDAVVESATGYGIQDSATLRSWLDLIVKESLGLLPLGKLAPFEAELSEIFSKITLATADNASHSRIFNPAINQSQVRSDIRCCFAPHRSFNVTEELVPEEASLLKLNAPSSPIEASASAIFEPSQKDVESIIHADTLPSETISPEIREFLIKHNMPLPDVEAEVNRRTYHYLPYHLDSTLEQDYLRRVITILRNEHQVEFYFNGDESLTDFRIRCYERRGSQWKLLGYYYPDFVMLTRTPDNAIDKIVIVETKGEGFAGKFRARKQFMEETFVRLNNEQLGRERFRFLYIEDTDNVETRIIKTYNIINSFLKQQ